MGMFTGALVLLAVALAVPTLTAAGSLDIIPINYFQAKYPYTPASIDTAFQPQLNNPYVCKTGTNVPGINQYHAVLSLAPCNYISEHYHPDGDEFNYMLSGNLSYTLILGNGTVIKGFSAEQTTNLMPKGLTHMLLNDNCGITTLFHYFPSSNPVSVWTLPSVETAPAGFKSSSFNGTLPGVILPDGIHTVDLACAARCGLNIAATFNTVNGTYAKGLCGFINPLFHAPSNPVTPNNDTNRDYN